METTESHQQPPIRLSAVPASPYFDKEACTHIDKVFVDGVHLPDCLAYDASKGPKKSWAVHKVAGNPRPKIYGEVIVTLKELLNEE